LKNSKKWLKSAPLKFSMGIMVQLSSLMDFIAGCGIASGDKVITCFIFIPTKLLTSSSLKGQADPAIVFTLSQEKFLGIESPQAMISQLQVLFDDVSQLLI